MGTKYSHVTIEERCEMARLRAEGYSIRQVAASLDRSPSTVSRELKRNVSRTRGYMPVYANQHAHARRWRGSKLERDAALRDRVLSRLQQGWSPEQVAGRLALESGRTIISHETIYRFVYSQLARKKDYSWRHYLPRAKSKRGWRGRKGGSPASFIYLRRPLSERPKAASDRSKPGHWEADLMMFRTYGQAVLTLHERHSRMVIALRSPSKAAAPIARAMASILAPLPTAWRQTITFDNGTEFARHHELHALGFETFFCNTRSPWQKGGVENAIGRMRRALPRKTDLARLPDKRFTQVLQAYNNTPRKCLGYQTPAETFWNEVLHFGCEFTYRLPPARRRKSSSCHTPIRHPPPNRRTAPRCGTHGGVSVAGRTFDYGPARRESVLPPPTSPWIPASAGKTKGKGPASTAFITFCGFHKAILFWAPKSHPQAPKLSFRAKPRNLRRPYTIPAVPAATAVTTGSGKTVWPDPTSPQEICCQSAPRESNRL